MKIIDEHVWDVKKLIYPWIERGSVIDRVFWIDNYRAATKDAPIEKMMFVGKLNCGSLRVDRAHGRRQPQTGND